MLALPHRAERLALPLAEVLYIPLYAEVLDIPYYAEVLDIPHCAQVLELPLKIFLKS